MHDWLRTTTYLTAMVLSARCSSGVPERGGGSGGTIGSGASGSGGSGATGPGATGGSGGVGASGGSGASGGAAGSSGGAAGASGGIGGTGGVAGSGGASGSGGIAGNGGGGRSGGAGASGSPDAGRDAAGGSGGKDGAAGSTGGGGTGGGQIDASIMDGGTVIWTATDYVSRKWARWAIPNPASMALPPAMSYTAGSDTITDNVTGLVWQRSTNTATTTWQGALDYCRGLGAGWSLPTRIELSSILDNTRSGGKVDPVFTFGNAAGWTWASTPWVVNERKGSTGDAALSWFINFSQGDSNNSLSQTAASAYSRCVQVPPTQVLPASHYTIANGEVIDNYTSLIWQQDHSGSTATLAWDDAVAYCNSLMLGGHAWRLPSLNEIASIVDDVPAGDVSPAVDHAVFPVTSPNLQYWSASPYGTNTAERWTLNFKDGFTAHRATSTLAIARCVR